MMTTLYRGLAVALIHSAIVLSVAGKYAFDRDRLPRVWAKTAPVDPNLPIRGRYVSLLLEVHAADNLDLGGRAQLSIDNGKLIAKRADRDGLMVWKRGSFWVLTEPVAFFIPEHAADPSRRAPGEELWVEVSVPDRGMPRPIGLAVKKDGEFKRLPLD
jgi:hypothetical protein